MTVSPTRPEPMPSGTPEWNAWAAENKGVETIVICWTVIAIATLFVIARLYVRRCIQKRLELDDYLIVASIVSPFSLSFLDRGTTNGTIFSLQICSYLSTALSTVSVNDGNGKHFAILSTQQQEETIMWTIAGFCPGVMSFGLPKLAVVVLLTRLLNPGRLHAAFLWFLGVATILVLAATVGVLVGRCQPSRAQWDFSVPGTCFSTMVLASYCIFAGAWSAFVDFYLAFYPASVLFNLRLPLRKKLALSCALGLGSISGIVASYKTSRLYLLASPDFSYDTSDLVIWTVIEGSVIIIASSIPLLQPLFDKAFGKGFFTSQSSKNKEHRKRGDYEDYSDAGIKASSANRNASSKRSKLSPYGDLEMTVIEDHPNMEEDTLPLAERQTVTVTAEPLSAWRGPDERKIMKTTNVSVAYGEVRS
ncbi:integral membrane protein [Xylariaceae sp. FL0255]|nr:integral membrane protein [Xylariaceae sp. FL0255]